MVNEVLLTGRIIEFEGEDELVLLTSMDRSGGTFGCVKIRLAPRLKEGTKRYCAPGDVIGIKGRMTVDGIVAERVALLKEGEKNK